MKDVFKEVFALLGGIASLITLWVWFRTRIYALIRTSFHYVKYKMFVARSTWHCVGMRMAKNIAICMLKCPVELAGWGPPGDRKLVAKIFLELSNLDHGDLVDVLGLAMVRSRLRRGES